MLEIAITTMINRFNLDETEYSMFKFSEGQKNVTIGMTNGDIPLTASFPRDFLRLEEMQTWSEGKIEMWMRNAMMNGTDVPEILLEKFPSIYQRVLDNPRGEVVLSEEELRELELADGSLEAEKEETAEEFEAKVEGKKKPKKKLSKKTA